MSTIRDVAKRSGLSVATVSAVINKTRPVSDAATLRVKQAIKELNYRPNHLARALSTKQSRTIGCLVPTVVNPFFPQILKSVEEVAFRHSHNVFICNTDGNPEKVHRYQQMLLEHQVAGVVTTLTWDLARDDVIRPFLDGGIPVVGLAGARMVEGIDAIIPDDLWGSHAVTSHLIQLGHHRIAFLGVEESETTKLRLSGFKQAHEEAGLDINQGLIRLGHDFGEGEGHTLAKQLLAEHRNFTAIVCYNDVIAQGVLSALAEEGVQVPKDISVAGYDDTIAPFSRPKLTSVAIPKDRMGRLAAEILIGRIKGQTGKPQRIKIRPELILRESVAPREMLQKAR